MHGTDQSEAALQDPLNDAHWDMFRGSCDDNINVFYDLGFIGKLVDYIVPKGPSGPFPTRSKGWITSSERLLSPSGLLLGTFMTIRLHHI